MNEDITVKGCGFFALKRSTAISKAILKRIVSFKERTLEISRWL